MIYKRLLKFLMDIFYPCTCPLCGAILKNQNSCLCKKCQESLKPITEPKCFKCGKPVKDHQEYCKDCKKGKHIYTRGVSAFVYTDEFRNAIIRFKYGGVRQYGDFFSKAMYKFCFYEIKKWNIDFIVPVPMYRGKEIKRGFNQSLVLAKGFSDLSNIPIYKDLVKKIKNTKAQKKLGADKRRVNLEKAFVCKKRIDGRNILVIDDVYTTGSTMDAMAKVLLDSGAKNVYFLTLCSGDGR